jgi:RNA recognition motif-containing protein
MPPDAPPAHNANSNGFQAAPSIPRSVGGPFNAPAEEATAHAAVSQRENRVYVGNLSYECRYKDLENFMTDGAFRSLGLGR